MARKTSLRDFQTYLAERLRSAASGEGSEAWLGIRSGERNWLVDLAESGEVIQEPTLNPVPMTQHWFAGIANIRGNLFAVSDFAAFCGDTPTPVNTQSSLLLIGSRFSSNAALLVSRTLGLKHREDFTPVEADPALPAWGNTRYTDRQGKTWHKLSVRELLADNQFMQIGA